MAYTPVKVGCWDYPLPPIAHWMRAACNIIPQFKAKALQASRRVTGTYRRLLGHRKVNIKDNKSWQIHRVSWETNWSQGLQSITQEESPGPHTQRTSRQVLWESEPGAGGGGVGGGERPRP